MELHPRAIEIAELSDPSASEYYKQILAGQITQAMQQAREQALEEAALLAENAGPTKIGDVVINKAQAIADAIRALKNKKA